MSNATDPITIRTFIMNNKLLKRPAFEGYQKFCEANGDDVVTFVDFEFWYYRFYEGNMDVNYDRSIDPKPLTFDNLPDEMITEIVSKLDLKSRLTSRKVCHKLLEVSSQMTIEFESIEVLIEKGAIELELNDESIEYESFCSGCTIKHTDSSRTVTLDDNYVTRAMEDLKIVLKTAKKIERFTIAVEQFHGAEKLIQILNEIRDESNGREFHVEKIRINHPCCYESVLSILALLKPRVLKKIDVKLDGMPKARNISRLQTMEQFKNAKEIDIILMAVIDADLIFNHFQHFDKFAIRVHSMSTDQIVRLRGIITSKIDSAQFEGCTIYVKESLKPRFDEIRQALGELWRQKGNSIDHHYEIPNSTGAYFELSVRFDAIFVTRQSQERNAPGRRDSSSSSSSSASSSSWSSSSSSSDSDSELPGSRFFLRR